MNNSEFEESCLNSIHDLRVNVCYLRNQILNMTRDVARFERSSNLLHAIGIVHEILLIVILCNVLVQLEFF